VAERIVRVVVNEERIVDPAYCAEGGTLNEDSFVEPYDVGAHRCGVLQ
jgi:hypothetical protein